VVSGENAIKTKKTRETVVPKDISQAKEVGRAKEIVVPWDIGRVKEVGKARDTMLPKDTNYSCTIPRCVQPMTIEFHFGSP
jgi:hypothetical protein